MGALADLDAGTETLAEFVEEWWQVYAGPNLERATLRAYATLWNGHALPRLGGVRLRRSIVIVLRIASTPDAVLLEVSAEVRDRLGRQV